MSVSSSSGRRSRSHGAVPRRRAARPMQSTSPAMSAATLGRVSPATLTANERRHHRRRRSLRGHGYFKRLGPGIVTGAADDDPSGIGTYSQVGAAHGLRLL